MYALAASGSNVYAGGRFGIAKWDGKAWTGLGSGLNGYVYALAVSGTNLYAGGTFRTAGGIAANNIARWNGSSWSALGSGIGESPLYWADVYAIAVSGSNVFVGGSFSRAGFVTANNIARWNGSSWSALGSGTSGTWNSPSATVHALASSGNDLYVGGEFSTAGGVTVNRIAKWDGSYWSALGGGICCGVGGQSVYALAVSGANVYAVGLFQSASGSTNGSSDIARWNGSSWSGTGLGVYVTSNYYPSVHAVAVSGNDLYVGGDFTYAGGAVTNRNAASRIAKWNGSAWSPLGSGLNDNVRVLAISGNDLYAGGRFTTAGGKAAAYVAHAYLPDLPILSLVHSETNVTVSWSSTNSAGFALEQAEIASASPKWASNTVNIADDGTTKSVNFRATNGSQIFRLRRP